MPDELWMKVRDIVQETGIKTIPKKKKGKKAKWLSEEALQIAVKRREVKSKGEKEGEGEVAQSCPTLCDLTGVPRQEYWSGLPFPSPGDLPDPED